LRDTVYYVSTIVFKRIKNGKFLITTHWKYTPVKGKLKYIGYKKRDLRCGPKTYNLQKVNHHVTIVAD
jgi:hypothetical protein